MHVDHHPQQLPGEFERHLAAARPPLRCCRRAPSCCEREVSPNCRSRRSATGGRRHRRRVLQPVRERGQLFQRPDRARRCATASAGCLPDERALVVERTPTLAATLRFLVGGIISWITRHEGVMRAALQHGDTSQDKWTHLQGTGARHHRTCHPLLLPVRWARGETAAKTRSIAFCFQVVLGTLVNAILNDPGPLCPEGSGDGGAARPLPAAVAGSRADGAGDGCSSRQRKR